MSSRTLLAVSITTLTLLIDQVSKIWIKTSMVLGEQHKVFGEWFRLYFVENEGMAMGISWGGELGKYSLTLFRLVAIGFIIYYIFTLIKKEAPKLFIGIMALVLAGAMGNVFDSLFYGLIFSDSTHGVASFVPWGEGYKSFMQGNVVDMLSFQFFRIPEWVPSVGGQNFFPYIFNVADAAISVGIILIIIFQGRFFPEEKEVQQAS